MNLEGTFSLRTTEKLLAQYLEVMMQFMLGSTNYFYKNYKEII